EHRVARRAEVREHRLPVADARRPNSLANAADRYERTPPFSPNRLGPERDRRPRGQLRWRCSLAPRQCVATLSAHPRLTRNCCRAEVALIGAATRRQPTATLYTLGIAGG